MAPKYDTLSDHAVSQLGDIEAPVIYHSGRCDGD
jgi:hypothetical protein